MLRSVSLVGFHSAKSVPHCQLQWILSSVPRLRRGVKPLLVQRLHPFQTAENSLAARLFAKANRLSPSTFSPQASSSARVVSLLHSMASPDVDALDGAAVKHGTFENDGGSLHYAHCGPENGPLVRLREILVNSPHKQ